MDSKGFVTKNGYIRLSKYFWANKIVGLWINMAENS